MLDTFIVFTSQMNKLAKFYEDGLKLGRPASSSDGHIGYPLPGGDYLGFDQIEGVEPVSARVGGVTLWFRVENVSETVERFIQLGAGIRYKHKETPFGEVLGSLYDLDGNIFGLAQE
jgi:hypothetical protein